MKVIEIERSTGEQIYFEITEVEVIETDDEFEGGKSAAPKDEIQKWIATLQDLGGAIGDICRTLHQQSITAIGDHKPNEFTLEFGIKLGGKAGIPLVTEGSAEGAIKIVAKWTEDKEIPKLGTNQSTDGAKMS